MKHKNAERYGFKIISTALEHENPYFSVYKYEVGIPTGTTHPFWVIEQIQFPVVIPLYSDKSTLLVGQYRVHSDFYSWEFPMGAAHGEDLLESAKSELLEETGLQAKRWSQIGSHFIGPGRANLKSVTYVAEDLEEGEANPEEVEFLTKKKLKVEEVGEMIGSGIIQDGPTIVAYHFLEKYLETK